VTTAAAARAQVRTAWNPRRYLGDAWRHPIARAVFKAVLTIWVTTTLTFFLVRQTVGAYVHRSPAVRFHRLRAIDERVARRGFVTVFVLRVIFCMAPPLTWALGATRVRWRDYLGGTALGITPGIGLGAYLGDAVTDATSWNALLAPHVVVPTLVAMAFAMTGAVVGRRVFGGGGAR